jgi:hypothetical protein
MGKSRAAYRVLVGNLREGDHLEDSGVDGRITLKWNFERLGKMQTITTKEQLRIKYRIQEATRNLAGGIDVSLL